MQSRTRLISLFLAAFTLLAVQPTLADGERVGEVARIQNRADVTADDGSRRLDAGAPIHLDDQVSTGPAARLEIALIDGTTLTLGESTRLVIDRFVFDPQQSRGEVLARVEGAFRFVTGQVGQLSETSIQAETPHAVISIRGTDFIATPIDGAYGVLLLDGAVEVTNNAGTATLDAPGEGVNLTGVNDPPGAVTQWPEEKAARARAAVAFAP